MVARAAFEPSGKMFGKAWKIFEKQAKGQSGKQKAESGNEEPECQTPRNQADFERMMKEEAP